MEGGKDGMGYNEGWREGKEGEGKEVSSNSVLRNSGGANACGEEDEIPA